MIPKIIWQTHEWDHVNLPINFKRATMTWKNLNPTWEYKYVNAKERAEQVKAFSNEAYLFYRFADKITQADLWRYITLQKHGGVYADMDSVCSTPLDYVLESIPSKIEFIATGLDENDRVNNANFGCVANSKVLDKLLTKILDPYKITDITTVLDLMSSGQSFEEATNYKIFTGPDSYSSVVLSSENVWFDYTGAIHTKDIKDDLDYMPIHIVNYYGERKSYLRLVQENDWSLI